MKYIVNLLISVCMRIFLLVLCTCSRQRDKQQNIFTNVKSQRIGPNKFTVIRCILRHAHRRRTYAVRSPKVKQQHTSTHEIIKSAHSVYIYSSYTVRCDAYNTLKKCCIIIKKKKNTQGQFIHVKVRAGKENNVCGAI